MARKVLTDLVSILAALILCADALAETYFVRPDGGTLEQCSGLADLPYPGTGYKESCAWDHPFRALPPGGEVRIQGGDTLLIKKGSYRMGLGAQGSEGCNENWPWECAMAPVPSGKDRDHPTRILGEGWDRGCPEPPELWGTERSRTIMDLSGSRDVIIGCLEITDHETCAEFHTGRSPCNRTQSPFGDWAAGGIFARDSSRVILHDLNIHGLAVFGIRAGRLEDWRLEDIRIAGNGWVGWDGDLGEDSANSGSIVFRGCTVEWNGCVETYPQGKPSGCWAQGAGGYGDGLGTAATGGDWVFEDSAFLHNTSDGLDLLYHSLGGTVHLNRVWAEGNAGNQVKVTGNASITNSLLVGNCAFFENKSFTFNVDPCRALGNTIEAVFTGGDAMEITSSTIYGQGDGLVAGGARQGFRCLGKETLRARNNIFLGDVEYLSQDGDMTFLFYQEGCNGLRMDSDFNVLDKVKSFACGTADTHVISGAGDLCTDPLLEAPFSGPSLGFVPSDGSPALDSADPNVSPPVDMRSVPRREGGKPDRGAFERITTHSFYIMSDGGCEGLAACYQNLQGAVLDAPSGATLFASKGFDAGGLSLGSNKAFTIYSGCTTCFSFCSSRTYTQFIFIDKGLLTLLGEIVLAP